jgi:phosphate-selective porin OprO/OprP
MWAYRRWLRSAFGGVVGLAIVAAVAAQPPTELPPPIPPSPPSFPGALSPPAAPLPVVVEQPGAPINPTVPTPPYRPLPSAESLFAPTVTAERALPPTVTVVPPGPPSAVIAPPAGPPAAAVVPPAAPPAVVIPPAPPAIPPGLPPAASPALPIPPAPPSVPVNTNADPVLPPPEIPLIPPFPPASVAAPAPHTAATLPPAMLPMPTALPGAPGLAPTPGVGGVPAIPAEPAIKAEPKSWVVGDNMGMTARWNHGLHVETIDRAFRIHPVGRIQYDNVFMTAGTRVQFAPGGVGRVDDGTAFRRLRLGVEGTIWEVVDFWIEPDYANTFNAEGPNENGIIANTFAPTDMWAQLTHIPIIGNLRFGSLKPAYSFEHMTSSRFLNFMERSLMFDAFVGGIDNGFQPGFFLFNWTKNERATWQASITHNTTNVFGFNVGDGEFNYAARVTGLPVYADEGRKLLHLGVSYSHRSLDDRQERFRARTSVRNGPAALATRLVDLRVAGDSRDMLIPEFVAVAGPLSIQAEYLGTWVQNARVPEAGPDSRPRGTLFFQGAYIDVMYFLTGEHRAYDTKAGAFTRVIPYENFFLVRDANGRFGGGMGAWQVGARYSYLNLNSKDVSGGIVHDMTLGVNWFWNPNMKWQCNYSLARRDVGGAIGNGIVQGFGLRFAMDF